MVCWRFFSGTLEYFCSASTTYSWLVDFNQHMSVLMPSTCVNIQQVKSLVKKIKNVWGYVKVSVQYVEDGSSHCSLSALCKRAGGNINLIMVEKYLFSNLFLAAKKWSRLSRPKPLHSSWKKIFSLILVIFTFFGSIFTLIGGSTLRAVIYIGFYTLSLLSSRPAIKLRLAFGKNLIVPWILFFLFFYLGVFTEVELK